VARGRKRKNPQPVKPPAPPGSGAVAPRAVGASPTPPAPPASPALAQAELEYQRLLALPDSGYAHLRTLELAAQLVWSLRADQCFSRGEHDAARKAAMTSSEHGKLAAKLASNSLVDRVAALEGEIHQRRSFGGELAALKKAEQP